MPVRRKYIREVAERMLNQHRIEERPIPVEKIADDLGITVKLESAEKELSGFIYRDTQGRRAVIGINSSHHQNRRRFTLAHELGHFILHNLDDVHVDRSFAVRLRNELSSTGTDIEEKEANLFAAELLMPKHFIERDLEHIHDIDLVDEKVIANLAGSYGVSTQAMTFRLTYLGCIHL